MLMKITKRPNGPMILLITVKISISGNNISTKFGSLKCLCAVRQHWREIESIEVEWPPFHDCILIVPVGDPCDIGNSTPIHPSTSTSQSRFDFATNDDDAPTHMGLSHSYSVGRPSTTTSSPIPLTSSPVTDPLSVQARRSRFNMPSCVLFVAHIQHPGSNLPNPLTCLLLAHHHPM